MVYHEIFVEPGGMWMARVYRDDQVVAQLDGEAKGYDAGRDAAIKAVQRLKESAGYVKKPWWRVW